MARSLVRENDSVWMSEADLLMSIDTEQFATWDNPDKEAAYHIRLYQPREVEAKRKPFAQQWFNPKTHRREERDMDPSDRRALQDELLKGCLLDWTGIDGNPPCEDDYKVALPWPVKAAIVAVATTGLVNAKQAREDSFRRPADVGRVLDG